MVHMCYCLNNAELPLKGNIDINKFKMYFCDTGLFVALLDDEAQEDFFVRTANNLIPVEVKVKNGKVKSLTQLIKSDKYSDIFIE